MTETYEDKLEQIMNFVRFRVNEKNKRFKIQDPEDLKALIREFQLDNRITDTFFESIKFERAAKKIVGKTIGDRGKLVSVIPGRREPSISITTQTKLQEKRKQGKNVFNAETPNRFAVEIMFTSRGKTRTRFQDILTGRFVKKEVVREKV